MDSGVIKRRMTGVGVALCFLAMWCLQGWFARVMLTVLGVIGVWEMTSALEHMGRKPVRAIGVIYMLMCLPVSYFWGFSGLYALTVIAAVVALSNAMMRFDNNADDAVMTLFPIVYPGMLFAVLIDMTNIDNKIMSTLIMGLIYVPTMLNDVMAYEIGTLYGKTPMAPKLSPKKTWEGSIAGVAASVAVSTLMPAMVRLMASVMPIFGTYEDGLFPPIWVFMIFGLVSGIATQAGDLCASMVKRRCGIKDYGTIFPGHGGVMDRMDGLLFSGLCACILIMTVMR